MSTWLEYNFENSELTKLAAKLGFEKPLHMTLAHFPRNISQQSILQIKNIVDKWRGFFPNRFWIYPKGEKLSQFEAGALVQEYNVPKRILVQRQILLQKFYDLDIKWSNGFDWNPHVTVAENKKHYGNTEAGVTRVLIIGITLHHSFGGPYQWWLKA